MVLGKKETMNGEDKASHAPFDFGFVGLVGLVMVVAGWLLTMPFCTFIQRTTLNRFHLQTQSFVVWAFQQPIPSMYNMYNRFEIRPSPWRTEPNSIWEKGTVNHFPLRMFTFGDNRRVFLRPDEFREIDIKSSYRGEHLHTRWTATPSSNGGFDLSGEVVP
jgi:hypothetical protein